jgi:cytochrome c-type biogenesis protein CcmH/NrfG
LKEQLAKNPNDATNWYNLGVMQAKTPATVNDALESFKKQLKLKPDFANAYQNLVYTTIGDDAKL